MEEGEGRCERTGAEGWRRVREDEERGERVVGEGGREGRGSVDGERGSGGAERGEDV